MTKEPKINDAQHWFSTQDESQINDLYLRLVYYTKKEINRLRWRTGKSGELPAGENAESLVQTAFVKVLSGERVWDLQKSPDFLRYLMDVLDSIINHLAEGKDNTLLVEFPVEEGGTPDNHDWLQSDGLSPEDEYIIKEKEALNQKALDMLEESVLGDIELEKILAAIRADCNKAGEISKHTGIEVTRVYDAMKRLNRKCLC